MIDRILAFQVLTKCSREFRQGLLAAYIDLCKAFHSVNKDALWTILGLRGVQPKLFNLMSQRYSGTESAVRCSDTISNLFPVVTKCISCVYWPPHFPALVWTGFCGGRLRNQDAVHHLGM